MYAEDWAWILVPVLCIAAFVGLIVLVVHHEVRWHEHCHAQNGRVVDVGRNEACVERDTGVYLGHN